MTSILKVPLTAFSLARSQHRVVVSAGWAGETVVGAEPIACLTLRVTRDTRSRSVQVAGGRTVVNTGSLICNNLLSRGAGCALVRCSSKAGFT